MRYSSRELLAVAGKNPWNVSFQDPRNRNTIFTANYANYANYALCQARQQNVFVTRRFYGKLDMQIARHQTCFHYITNITLEFVLK